MKVVSDSTSVSEETSEAVETTEITEKEEIQEQIETREVWAEDALVTGIRLLYFNQLNNL